MRTAKVLGPASIGSCREVQAEDFFCDDSGALILLDADGDTVAVFHPDQRISAERQPEKPN